MDHRLMLDDTFLIIDSPIPSFPDGILRLGGYQPRSTVLGPGERAVVWVAGCRRRCPGCMKPDLFSFDSGEWVSVSELADRILQVPGLQGVTYSGGEPFEQAIALAALSFLIKQSGLDILVYTGYRLSELRANPVRFGPLLAVADYLIDGEYREDLPGPFLWRGSGNQRLYDLRYSGASIPDTTVPLREIQLSIGQEAVRMMGFPHQALTEQLSQSLSKRGIELVRVRGASPK